MMPKLARRSTKATQSAVQMGRLWSGSSMWTSPWLFALSSAPFYDLLISHSLRPNAPYKEAPVALKLPKAYICAFHAGPVDWVNQQLQPHLAILGNLAFEHGAEAAPSLSMTKRGGHLR